MIGLEGVAGGGAGLSFATHYSKKDSLLTIDPTALSAGTYFVWITDGTGEATLVSILVK